MSSLFVRLPYADKGYEALKCCRSSGSARVAVMSGKAERWLGPSPRSVSRLEARDHGSLACEQMDAGSAPHLLLCQLYWLNLCFYRKLFGVTSLAQHRSRERDPGGNCGSTGTRREDVKPLQRFCKQMPHPGLMCHKQYPLFLSERQIPPFVGHKNGIVRLKIDTENKMRKLRSLYTFCI